jgi:hypothetical protein
VKSRSAVNIRVETGVFIGIFDVDEFARFDHGPGNSRIQGDFESGFSNGGLGPKNLTIPVDYKDSATLGLQKFSRLLGYEIQELIEVQYGVDSLTDFQEQGHLVAENLEFGCMCHWISPLLSQNLHHVSPLGGHRQGA